jgi:hypothetical protein
MTEAIKFIHVLRPAMGRVRDEAINLMAEDVIMCCLVGALKHLEGR